MYQIHQNKNVPLLYGVRCNYWTLLEEAGLDSSSLPHYSPAASESAAQIQLANVLKSDLWNCYLFSLHTTETSKHSAEKTSNLLETSLKMLIFKLLRYQRHQFSSLSSCAFQRHKQQTFELNFNLRSWLVQFMLTKYPSQLCHFWPVVQTITHLH